MQPVNLSPAASCCRSGEFWPSPGSSIRLNSTTNCNKLARKPNPGRHFERVERSETKREISRAYRISFISALQEISRYARNDASISASFSNILTLKASTDITQEEKCHPLVVTKGEYDQLDMFRLKIMPKSTTNGNKMPEILRKTGQFWPILIIYHYLCHPKNLLKKEDFKFGRKSNY